MNESLVIREPIDSERASAFAGVIGSDDVDVTPGSALPPMWQVAFFLPRPVQGELGLDGHPKDGFPTPPAEGLRRMFAGGRLILSPGLVIGCDATASTAVSSTRRVDGRFGPMTFVTTTTDVVSGGRTVLSEERDVVYLRADSAEASKPKSSPATEVQGRSEIGASAECDVEREVTITPTLLFRFSALTYNAHRIHYDRDYARGEEGYPGLVVHGPLQAVLMAEEGRRLVNRNSRLTMSYKLTAPLFEDEGLIVKGRRDGHSASLRIENAAGRCTAIGKIALEESDTV